MDAVRIEIEKRERDRVYSDTEIKVTWTAANLLDDPIERDYIKLLMLLALRKTAVAQVDRTHVHAARRCQARSTLSVAAGLGC